MENNSERKVVTEVRSLSLEEIELNLTMIPEKEQKVLELRYGLDGGNIRTQKEVAEILGISVSSVNRLQIKGVNHIKMIEMRDSRKSR